MDDKDRTMDDVELKTEPRMETGSSAARRTRRAGMVPCILYGLSQKNMPLTVPLGRLENVLRTGKRMVDLHVGQKKEIVLVKDVQHDPITDRIIHADFERVAMDEEIEIAVPITLKGRAKGQDEGGVLDQVLKSLQVRCLPKDIPEEIVVDIAGLDIGDSHKVAGIQVPDRVTPTANADEIVVVVHPPAREEEEAPPEEEAAAEPEVITAAEPEPEAEEGEEGKEEKARVERGPK